MYNILVTKIKVSKHPNADRLQIGHIFGSQVIVGLNVKDDDLGLYFPTDGQLSEEYATFNDLVAKYDENGNKISGGYFNEKRRVTAQTFRKVKSDGFWMPISSISYITGYEKLKDGDILLEDSNGDVVFNGHKLARKYFTPATLQQRTSNKVNKTTVNMPEHKDTDQFAYYYHTIPVGAKITITSKLHGTSQRYGNVRTAIMLPWYKRLINKVYPIFATTKHQHHIGTRRVILKEDTTKSYYGNEQFRKDVVDGVVLQRGEIIYGEVVGYVDINRPIMAAHDTSKYKELKNFNDPMIYNYGLRDGEATFYVYRITQENKDGMYEDLSMEEVISRAKELGLNTVPVLDTFIYHGNSEALFNLVDTIVNGKDKKPIPDFIDKSHLLEGVVIRVDYNGTTTFYKHKNWWFKLLEGIVKDTDVVDIEESA